MIKHLVTSRVPRGHLLQVHMPARSHAGDLCRHRSPQKVLKRHGRSTICLADVTEGSLAEQRVTDGSTLPQGSPQSQAAEARADDVSFMSSQYQHHCHFLHMQLQDWRFCIIHMPFVNCGLVPTEALFSTAVANARLLQ